MKLHFILFAFLCASPVCLAKEKKASARGGKNAAVQPVNGKVHPAFKEPVLTKQAAGSKVRIYRLVIAPVWGPLFCMRVQNNPEGGATITVKNLKYEKESHWKELVEEKPVTLTGAEFAEFEALIAKTGYEKMGPKDYGVDGDIWALEVSKAGFFHKAERWCPNAFNPEKKGTVAYAAAFRWVADKAQVTARITNKSRSVFDRE